MVLSAGSASPVQPGNVIALRPGLLAPADLIDLQSKRSRFVKRTGDIVFSLSVLTVGAPVFIALALLVRASSRGPIFYVQPRIGRDYKTFGCVKFRTMRKDSDKILHSLLSSSPELKEEF
ncbi:MAG: sugar transferase, partial [Cyanobium sp.]